jgi:hypothetical protein
VAWLREVRSLVRRGCWEIMVSAWWIIWAFVIGGYAGMLLIALMVIARKAQAPGSAFE